MTLHTYLLTAILTWSHPITADDAEACEKLAQAIEKATVVRLPGYSTRAASAIRLFSVAAFESPLVPPYLTRFVNRMDDCPPPFSCDNGNAKSPWQMHLNLTSLDQAAQFAYEWLAEIPGAWTTFKVSSQWSEDYLLTNPPPEDEEYQLPEYPLVR